MGRRSSSPRHVIAVLSALVGTEQGVTPVGEDGHDELQALADGMKGQSVAHMTRSSSAWYAALEEGAILRSSPDGMSEQIGSRLSQLGYTIVESKLRGTLAVNGNGEFMLSRDARKIAAAHDAQAVVTGNYAAGSESAIVSLKLIRLTDAKVLAAFDYSMPMGPNTRSLMTPVVSSERHSGSPSRTF